MSTIMVVDDIPMCLEMIAAILRKEGYHVCSASSGEEALASLGRQQVDLLLLDVMMPGIDGLSVLNMLRKDSRWRNLPVILLTDVADKGRVQTAANLRVQGYLLKSHFTVPELLSRVQNCLAPPRTVPVPDRRTQGTDLRGASTSRAVDPKPITASSTTKAEVLARVRRHLGLKSVPPVLHYVISLANNSRSSLDDIVNAVRQDQALALRVMKVANSSFYLTETRAGNLIEATQRIGLSGLRNAATAILAMDHFAEASNSGLIPQRFWEHSLATAVLAQMIGEAADVEKADELFLAGLLHDIGRLILSIVFPREYRQVLAVGRDRGVDLIEAEREVFGLDHNQITLEVLKELQMVDVLVAAASSHHRRLDELKRAGRNSRCALAVCLADRLAHAMALGDSGNAMLYPFHDVAEALGLAGDVVGKLARTAANRTRDAELVFACQTDVEFREPFPDELRRQAEGSVRLVVLASAAPNDAFSLFFERMGWSESANPELALLYARSAREPYRLAELQRLEDGLGTKLPVLLRACPKTLS